MENNLYLHFINLAERYVHILSFAVLHLVKSQAGLCVLLDKKCI